jgi:hypothetical protein
LPIPPPRPSKFAFGAKIARVGAQRENRASTLGFGANLKGGFQSVRFGAVSEFTVQSLGFKGTIRVKGLELRV